MLHVEHITDTNGFRRLEPEWNSLLSRTQADSIFSTFEWNFTWWEFFSEGKELCILVIKDGDQMLGIAPLQLCHSSLYEFPLRLIEFIGMSSEDLADYHDFIFLDTRSDECAKAVVSWLQANIDLRDLIHLQFFSESSPNYAPVANRLKDSCFLSEDHALYAGDRSVAINVSPYIDLDWSWEEYFSTRKKSLRTDVKRQWRRLEKLGVVEFSRCVDAESLSWRLDQFFALHKARWASEGSQSKLFQVRIEEFYRRIAHIFLLKGWLDFSWITHDGHPIAFHLGFVRQGVVYYYIPAFDVKYENFSPGKLMLMCVLKDAFANQTREVDLLRGDEVYKQSWATGCRQLKQIRGCKRSLVGGMLHLWIEDLRPRLSRVSLLRHAKALIH